MKLASLVRLVLLAGTAALILAAAVTRPGVSLEPPWPVLAAAGVLSICVGLALPLLGITQRARRSGYLAAFLVGWIGVAWLLGDPLEEYRTQIAFSHWLGFLSVFCGVLLSVRTRADWRLLGWLLCSISTLLSLYGIAQYRSQDQERLLSTFVNADSFSVYPMCCLLLSLGMVRGATARGKIVLQAFVFVQLLALLLTGSRAGLLGLLIGVCLLAALLAARCVARKRDFRPVVETMSPLLMTIVLIGLSSLFVLPSLTRWGKLFSGEETQGVAMRRDVITRGFAAVASRPLRGYGAGNFAYAYQQFRPFSELNDRMYVNVAHNDYVELAVECGILALLLWLGLLVHCTQVATRYAERSPWGYECAAACAAVWAVGVYSLLNFTFAVPADHFLFAAMLALSIAAVHAGDNFVTPRSRGVLIAWGGVMILLGFWAMSLHLANGRAYREVILASEKADFLDLERAAAHLERAAQLTPTRADIHFRLAEVLSQLAELNNDPQLRGRSIHEQEVAVRLSPRNLTYTRGLARTYLRLGRLKEAETLLRTAVKSAGYADDLRVSLSHVLVGQGRVTEASKIMAEVYSRDDEFQRSLTQLLIQAEMVESGNAQRVLTNANLAPQKLGPLVKAVSDGLIANKRWEEADSVQRVWGLQNGEDTAYWISRSKIWAAAGQPARQLKYLENAVEDKNVNSADYEHGLILYATEAANQKQTARAQKRLSTYLERGSAGPLAYAALARLHLANKHLEAARKVIVAGLETHQQHPSLLLVRARLALLQSSPDSALEDAREVLDAEPNNAEARQLMDEARKAITP